MNPSSHSIYQHQPTNNPHNHRNVSHPQRNQSSSPSLLRHLDTDVPPSNRCGPRTRLPPPLRTRSRHGIRPPEHGSHRGIHGMADPSRKRRGRDSAHLGGNNSGGPSQDYWGCVLFLSVGGTGRFRPLGYPRTQHFGVSPCSYGDCECCTFGDPGCLRMRIMVKLWEMRMRIWDLRRCLLCLLIWPLELSWGYLFKSHFSR